MLFEKLGPLGPAPRARAWARDPAGTQDWAWARAWAHGTATAAATATAEEFLGRVQAPSPSHPGIKYPVRGPPLTLIL